MVVRQAVRVHRGGLSRLLAPDDDGGPMADESTDRQGATLMRMGDWRVFASAVAVDGPGRRQVAEFMLPDGTALPLVEDDNGVPRPPFSLEEAYGNYLTEAWTAASTNRRLSSDQLQFFYRYRRFVPRGVQLRARRRMIRWQGAPEFPAWPLDDGVNRLLRLDAARRLAASGERELAFRWFWPRPYRAAIVLSHDVESVEGIRRAVELADLEEGLGFRSAFNFGAWYEIDPGVLRELTSRGFEIGMHGIAHDRSLFSSRGEFERQLPLLRELASRLGAVGFRSPATHRVFDWLAELPVEYDCTIPHSDPYEPQPGGCCSLWPFFVGDVVELPYTLPQDHTLLTLLRHRSAALWIDTARAIEDRFGLVQCLTHPDPGYLGDANKRGIYEEFLRAMAEREHVWRALPREVAAWWRHRDAGDPDLAYGRVEAGPSTVEASLTPPAPPSPA